MIRNKALVGIGIYLSLLLFVFTFAGVEVIHYPLLHSRCSHPSAPSHETDSGGNVSLIAGPEKNAVSSICSICTLFSYVQLVWCSARSIAALFDNIQFDHLFPDSGFLLNIIAELFTPRGPPAFFNHNLSV